MKNNLFVGVTSRRGYAHSERVVMKTKIIKQMVGWHNSCFWKFDAIVVVK